MTFHSLRWYLTFTHVWLAHHNGIQGPNCVPTRGNPNKQCSCYCFNTVLWINVYHSLQSITEWYIKDKMASSALYPSVPGSPPSQPVPAPAPAPFPLPTPGPVLVSREPGPAPPPPTQPGTCSARCKCLATNGKWPTATHKTHTKLNSSAFKGHPCKKPKAHLFQVNDWLVLNAIMLNEFCYIVYSIV